MYIFVSSAGAMGLLSHYLALKFVIEYEYSRHIIYDLLLRDVVYYMHFLLHYMNEKSFLFLFLDEEVKA